MKHLKKIFALALSLALTISCIPSVLAATSETATIDMDRECCLTLYKYDWTNASKDGIDLTGVESSGWRDTEVEALLGNTAQENGTVEQALGNGETSNGYAIKGVGFTIANVAKPVRSSDRIVVDDVAYSQTQLVYEFNRETSADLLAAIGLEDGKDCYIAEDESGALNHHDNWYYTSDVIIAALADSLLDNATTVKNALENYIVNNGGIEMPETDSDGRTSVDGLDVGLYLAVETSVPEMVTNTTNPFFISLPMTTVNNNMAGDAPEGGHEWNYDVTVYPKNETGIPSLEKTVREDKVDTGNNNGSANIEDGFAHTATGSAGDTMQYQIITSLPTITSDATALTTYSFFDTIAVGMTYNKDVTIEIFTDHDCTDPVISWAQDSGQFEVTYSDDDQSMTIEMTDVGLNEINDKSYTNVNGSVYVGYSNYTMRVTYSAQIDSAASVVYGDDGNCNKVVLTWKRSNTDYYDTLIDDCHVYTYGINLTKLFSDATAENANADHKYDHVKFVLFNETDNYWVAAKLNEAEGVYYVTDHVANEEDATVFTPVKSGDEFGKVIIRGTEDDEYKLFEIETADGYTLLKEPVSIILEAHETYDVCDIYSEDVLGVLQNDPRYGNLVNENIDLSNTPQEHLSHYLLSVDAYINGQQVSMVADEDSANAEALMTIVNTPGFDLPQTGDQGVWMYGVAGGTMMLAAVLVILFAFKKKEDQDTVSQ